MSGERSDDGGYVLVEVLVAATILGLVGTILLQVFGDSAMQTRDRLERVSAHLNMESLITELRVTRNLADLPRTVAADGITYDLAIRETDDWSTTVDVSARPPRAGSDLSWTLTTGIPNE